MDLQLAGKRAIVTGGSRGIGKAIALRLAQEGADVAVVARTPEPLRAAADEIAGRTGRRVIDVPTDTGDDDAVRAMVQRVVTELGGVDILVNAAAEAGGRQPTPSTLADITGEAVFEQVNVKAVGYLRCAREVAPHMRAAGWGRIVNISGLAARQSGNTVGSIRNVAVSALTKNLADQLGPDGINVTVVHPGLTETERTPETLAALAQASGRTPEEVRAGIDARNALGRMITADEVADVVAFLASPRSVAINGDAIAAGGGVGQAIHY